MRPAQATLFCVDIVTVTILLTSFFLSSFGLRHYMESSHRLAMSANQTSSPYDDDILLLLDPDMILLRPVVHDFTSSIDEPLLWVEEGDTLPNERKVVRHGHPIAQQDPFLGNEWMYGALDRIGLVPWKGGFLPL